MHDDAILSLLQNKSYDCYCLEISYGTQHYLHLIIIPYGIYCIWVTSCAYVVALTLSYGMFAV